MTNKKDTQSLCKNCWGKGYSTEFIGDTKQYPDFIGSRTHILRKGGTRVRLCSCERGSEIKKYFTIKKQKAL